jgi:DNA-directed RNA polymerase specialized sigma24 family protein
MSLARGTCRIFATGSPTAEQVYSKREELEGLSRTVGQLPTSLRSVLLKVCEEECTVQESADAMGI